MDNLFITKATGYITCVCCGNVQTETASIEFDVKEELPTIDELPQKFVKLFPNWEIFEDGGEMNPYCPSCRQDLEVPEDDTVTKLGLFFTDIEGFVICECGMHEDFTFGDNEGENFETIPVTISNDFSHVGYDTWDDAGVLYCKEIAEEEARERKYNFYFRE